MQHHLGRSEKDAELKVWTKATQSYVSCEPRPGKGFPDPLMVPWCERLNEIGGLCTMQSCTGHRTPDGSIVGNGVVCLWLSEPMLRSFMRRGVKLAQHPCVEYLSLIFHTGGADYVAEIMFKGEEQQPSQLDESMTAIVEFFVSLAADLVWGTSE